jgi:hypothetical protein
MWPTRPTRSDRGLTRLSQARERRRELSARGQSLLIPNADSGAAALGAPERRALRDPYELNRVRGLRTYVNGGLESSPAAGGTDWAKLNRFAGS